MRRSPLAQPGMTLVELLVVITIMVLLLAVSVPILKPLSESSKTSGAAQVLAGAFQQARTKAIQERRDYGLRLIPYKTAPTAVVEMHLQRGGAGIMDFVNPPDVRVKIVSGRIVPYCFYENGWQQFDALPEGEKSRWAEKFAGHFEEGYTIQFNRLGRSFTIGGNWTLRPPYDGLNLPEDNLGNDAMEYRISTRDDGVSLAWRPPIVMPRTTIVDLVFSGGEDEVPTQFSPGDEVIVMFSPTGYVDWVSINGERKSANEMLYFCVGEWDRQVDTNGNPLAEDRKSNLAAKATFWVTLHPKTGGVRVTENSPIEPASTTLHEQIKDARRYAKEHFFDVGGK